ncbi:MAG: NADH-quinone oxidoreductase subunit J family protein [Solirubrobacteraceae bacterium]
MSAFFFFLAAIGAITGAVGVVSLRDPFFSVLALVVHLVSLAALFLLLRAEFVAAVQVVVYAGAVMVLYVFVVAYVGGISATLSDRMGGGAMGSARMKLLVCLGGGALLAELLIALLGSGLKAIGRYGAPYHPGAKAFGTPGYIGELLLTRFLLAFEIASFLLLVAAVGAVLLAGRTSDPSSEEGGGGLAALTRRRPLGTGTMAEGVEGRGPVTASESREAEGEGSGQLIGGGAR